MLLLAFVSPVLGTNCYVVARDDGGECLVVDPGIAVHDELEKIFAERSLRPTGALITHGHVDHTLSLASLCRSYELPVYIHHADEYRLDDPIGTLGAELASAFSGLADDWSRPPDVRPLYDDAPFTAAGIEVRPIHAPGHTEGSVLYVIDGAGEDGSLVCFTGDVLFAGTVGRTDLPGGDAALMEQTLARLATPDTDGGLPDATTVLPGHGDSDSLGSQRASNPFLIPFQTSARQNRRGNP